MEIVLTEEERALLVELLDAEVQSLHSEIYRAESHEAKTLLKERMTAVTNLLQKVQQAST
jgi:hypothetical protein